MRSTKMRPMVYVPAGGMSAGFTEKESTDA
jgi:hypothetical protein